MVGCCSEALGGKISEGKVVQGNKKGPERDLVLSATVRPPCDVSHVRRWRPGYNKDETHGVRLRLREARTIGEGEGGCQAEGATAILCPKTDRLAKFEAIQATT